MPVTCWSTASTTAMISGVRSPAGTVRPACRFPLRWPPRSAAAPSSRAPAPPTRLRMREGLSGAVRFRSASAGSPARTAARRRTGPRAPRRTANIQRQLAGPSPASSQLTMYASRMPVTMAIWLSETRRPRIAAGRLRRCTSGASTEATPMAMPPMKRATVNSARFARQRRAQGRDAKSSGGRIRMRRRPKRSLSVPATLAPATQPTSRRWRPHSVCTSESANCCRRKMMAPLMTAMSKPNSSPEMAATAETM